MFYVLRCRNIHGSKGFYILAAEICLLQVEHDERRLVQTDALHFAIPGPLDGQTWTRCFRFMFVTEQCNTASREGLVDFFLCRIMMEHLFDPSTFRSSDPTETPNYSNFEISDPGEGKGPAIRSDIGETFGRGFFPDYYRRYH